MGFRFRKRIRILPGIWLNLSKRGTSASFGGKGLNMNVKEGKVRTTASLPGTGLSYRTTSIITPPTRSGIPGWIWVFIVVVGVLVFLVKNAVSIFWHLALLR
jgi:hypothetical protein